MKKNINLSVVCFCMAVILAGVSVKDLFAQGATVGKASKAVEELNDMEVFDNVAPAITISRPKVDYRAEHLKDPFQEPNKRDPGTGASRGKISADQALPALKVQGVIWGTKLPQAIIDNKVVKVGDMIGEVKILEITKAGVTVYFNSQNYNLPSPAGGPVVEEGTEGGNK